MELIKLDVVYFIVNVIIENKINLNDIEIDDYYYKEKVMDTIFEKVRNKQLYEDKTNR
jgi:hypothetical protein